MSTKVSRQSNINNAVTLVVVPLSAVRHFMYGSAIVLLLLLNLNLNHMNGILGLGARQQRQHSQRQQSERERERPYRNVKILHGILTADLSNEEAYRKRHRDLFALWNDDRVCTLHSFLHRDDAGRDQCQFIYTFVMGSNPNGTTILLHNESSPWLVTQRPIVGSDSVQATDLNHPDILHLNCKENMNEGKTPTWFAYAASVAQDYGIDYISKCDTDTIVYIHHLFRFAHWHMPPAPYNAMTAQCAPMTTKEHSAFGPRDNFHATHFNRLYTYCGGELYTLSTSLAVAVTKELRTELQRHNDSTCHYCSGYEDIDMFAVIFHVYPFKLTFVSYAKKYWQHQVKSNTEPWNSIWKMENARMLGRDRYLTTQSRYQDMLLEPQLTYDTLPSRENN